MAMHTGRDPFGHPLTVAQPDSVAALCSFIEGFLSYQPRILAILPAAEVDDSLIVQAAAAALWMFSESPVGPPKARAHLARAQAAGLPCSERERAFAAAIEHWVEGRSAEALATHAEIQRQHPRDLCALKLGQYHAFNIGDSPTMLRLALAAAPAAQDLAWLHGMLAFAHEQCHDLARAETCARHALSLEPAEPWAQHAIAHVMLTQGRHAEGVAFMAQASGHWAGLTSFMRTHNWWHLALFHIELGDTNAALALYDEEVWGVDKDYSQDQVGAVSLLARLELAGLDVGERWQDLATHLGARTADHVQPFLDLQYLYGLARAGRPEADRLLVGIERFAAQAAQPRRRTWQRVVVPAALGLLAHARGQWAQAVDGLATALPRLAAIGGSHAQRELFEQIYLDALARDGQWGGVLDLVKPRADAQPASQRLAHKVAAARRALGLPAG
jgi:tetratricopeptide (TPR) repeat protein